jgi:ABC-type glycerol-3-phosphate transport system permease component
VKLKTLAIQVPLYAVLLAAVVAMLTPLVWLVAAGFKDSDDLFHYMFFPPLSHLSTENFEKLFGSPALTSGEIQDLPGLCRKVEKAGREVAAGPAGRLWSVLAEEDRARIAAVAKTGEADAAEERPLVAALNRALVRPDLLAKADLAGLALSEEGQRLADRMATGLAPDEAHRLNRLALEAALPAEVGRSVSGIPFGRYVMNSLFVAGASVLIQMFFASLGGFALAKYQFRAKKLIMTIMLATMMIPGQVMLAPLYELIYKMGMMDSYLGLIVPGMVSVFGMFLFRQAMLQIPDELLEAARMDGCTEFGVYWNVALPVSRPMIGAFCLVAFMGNWNSFLWPQIVLHTSDLFTLPIGLNQMVGTYNQQYGLMMAGTLLAILPVMILFFILQREFISGLTQGAVKG